MKPKRQHQSNQIALALPRGEYLRELLRGVDTYAQRHERIWSYLTPQETFALSVLDLTHWEGAGVIAPITTQHEEEYVKKMTIPVVNISGILLVSPTYRVRLDDEAIGRMAAEHFLEKGFRHLAYYGLDGLEYSNNRLAGFQTRLAAHNRTADMLTVLPSSRLGADQRGHQYNQLVKWLKNLRKPVGLFVVNDSRARFVTDVCASIGLDIPNEVAVLGVDNDPVLCEYGVPALSSIDRSSRHIGYAAAQLLDTLIQGREPERREYLIPPGPLVPRTSTQTMITSNARLQNALRFIHEHHNQPLNVGGVCKAIGMSRRRLEVAFRDHIGCTPYQYLLRQRVQAARKLLTQSNMTTLEYVASESGFNSAKQMHGVFQRLVGVSPSQYRHKSLKNAVKGLVDESETDHNGQIRPVPS